MKFSFEWLKELTKFEESPEKLAEFLTLYLAETTVSYRGKRAILDVDLLPNRIADASGHLGLSREISALLGKQFVSPQPKLKENKQTTKSWIKVSIKSPSCKRYVARTIWHVKVKPSPQWLKERLEDCGIRSINNIVDATNYVMLLTGQPLHVFDFQKMAFNKEGKKEIIVRQAKKGETITTLERRSYQLNENNLLIYDQENPLALAGIKGGVVAEVDKNTRFVILESANFKGVNIHLTSQALGLRTDASWRFEHNLDPELTTYAIDLLAQIIQQVAGGDILKGKVDEKNYSSSKTILPLSFKTCEKILGWPIKKQEIIKTLKLLGFQIQERKDYLLVNPPSFRNDILNIEDVVGEIARLQGFEKIPSLAPKELITLPTKNEFWEFKERIKDWLKDAHLEEVYNYSLISQKDKDNLPLDWQKQVIALANPLSDLFAYLRTTCLFNFLKNVNDNFRFVEEVRFFEIGKIYRLNKIPEEETVFSGVLARKTKNLKNPLFYEAKGIIEELFTNLGIDPDDYDVQPMEKTSYHLLLSQGMAFLHNKKLIGVLGMPPKSLLKKYDLEGEIVFWEIKLLPLMQLEESEREFEPLPQYPAAIRDISLLINKDILIDKILKTIQENSSFLEDVDLFDIYEGETLTPDKQSLSFHLIFRSPNKTLTTEEISQEMKKIYQALQKLGAQIR
ncbi:MAG: phenylalanine--tRNA ligase subunit beta [Minisyncoccia bacterium]